MVLFQKNGPSGLRCRAKYNCEADNEDELSFEQGETIVIVREEEEEWWVSLCPFYQLADGHDVLSH